MCYNQIKDLLSKIDRSSFEIAFWNGAGSLLAVGIPTIMDPLLEHHVRYGSRTYPFGKWIFLIGIIVFFLTYISNSNKKLSTKNKALFTLVAIFLPTWLTLPFFKPEFPHPNVVFTPIYFGLISASAVVLRGYEIDFSSLNDSNISPMIKLERLKLEYDFWKSLGVASLATYGLFVISIAMQMGKTIETITKEPSEIFLMNGTFAFSLILNAVWFLKGFLIEIISKINYIRNSFDMLK